MRLRLKGFWFVCFGFGFVSQLLGLVFVFVVVVAYIVVVFFGGLLCFCLLLFVVFCLF